MIMEDLLDLMSIVGKTSLSYKRGQKKWYCTIELSLDASNPDLVSCVRYGEYTEDPYSAVYTCYQKVIQAIHAHNIVIQRFENAVKEFEANSNDE